LAVTARCWALAVNWRAIGVPLIGINQGRLGFITDIPFDSFAGGADSHAARRV
jgi:NAD kinase